MKYGWSCDPGNVDNVCGQKTVEAVKQFQTKYNSEFPNNASLTVDGRVGPKTWQAIFHVLRNLLENGLRSANLIPIPALSYGYPAGNGIYPCGESSPLSGVERSEEDRRVELVFYNDNEWQPAITPAAGRVIPQNRDPVTEKGWEKTPVEANVVEVSQAETETVEAEPEVVEAEPEKPTLVFLPEKSELMKLWVPSLENGPQKITAYFKVSGKGSGQLKAELIKGGAVLNSLVFAYESETECKVEWDGKDQMGKPAPEDTYCIKCSLIKDGEAVAEAKSSNVKIIKVAVSEIYFVDSYPIKFCTAKYVNDDLTEYYSRNITSPQWKKKSFDSLNSPIPNMDKISEDENNFNYPVCYTYGKSFSCEVNFFCNNVNGSDGVIAKLLSKDIECTLTDISGLYNGKTVKFDNVQNPTTDINMQQIELKFKFQYQVSADTFMEMGEIVINNIILFSILSVPKSPWKYKMEMEDSSLWVSVLKLLCGDWVKGLKTATEVTTKITEKIYNSGFIYEDNIGAPSYSFGRTSAFLSKWMFHLTLVHNQVKTMDCTDCATILTVWQIVWVVKCLALYLMLHLAECSTVIKY